MVPFEELEKLKSIDDENVVEERGYHLLTAKLIDEEEMKKRLKQRSCNYSF